jgi:transcriptional regulator with XRE-family HTH domain
VTTNRHRELAAFLRSRRERRSPEDSGLPPGWRRRTPGLRREEVADLAGVSVTWYTWLEQARDIRVTPQVLKALASALGLDGVETAHLFRLAGRTPPTGHPTASRDGLAPQYRLLLEQLEPNPAFLVSSRFDILAWNRGCEILYDLSALPESDRNVLWLTFTDPKVRTLTEDWEQEVSFTLAFFRKQIGEGVLEPEVAGLIERLTAASEDFRRLWHRKDLAPFAPQSRTIHHPKLGRVELEHVKMHMSDDDKAIVAFLAPVGSDLARALAALIEDDDL